jgi:hypothetical protein
MPVYVSLEGFPSNESLRMTGYLPAFVGSMRPGAAIEKLRCEWDWCWRIDSIQGSWMWRLMLEDRGGVRAGTEWAGILT